MSRLDSYKFELACGLLTGLLGVSNCLVGFFADAYSMKPLNSIKDFTIAVFGLLAIPLLVAVGAYLHTIKQSTGGLLMLTVGAFLSALMIFATLFVILFSWYYPLWLMVVALSPNLMGVITLIVLIVEKFNRTKPYSSSTPGNLST